MTTMSTSVDPLTARLQALEDRIADLERRGPDGPLTHLDRNDEARTLRDLFDYAVLRPVDLVKLDGDPYFMYVKDLAYTFFAEHKPETFIRNYQLTEDDAAPPPAFPFSISDFYGGRAPAFARNEQYFKFVIFAHLWIHGIDFTMLDIGANIGFSSVPCAKFALRFNRTIQIHAFEPGMAAELLAANLRLNHVDGQVRPDGRAVSDCCRPVAMNSMLGHSVCDSINDFRKHYPQMVPALARIVDTVTVDAFVREHGIDQKLILKIDAEGHDWQVLQGACNSFERGQVAATIVEFVPHYLKEFIEPAQMLIDLARDHHLLHIIELGKGYTWRGHRLSDDPTELREFTRSVARSPLAYTDVLAISKSVPEAERLAWRLSADG